MTTKGSMTDTELKCLEDALITNYMSATVEELDEALINMGLEDDFRQLTAGIGGMLDSSRAAQDVSIADLRKAYERAKRERRSAPTVAVSAARKRIAEFLAARPSGISERGLTLQFRELDSLADDDILSIYMDLVSHGLINDESRE